MSQNRIGTLQAGLSNYQTEDRLRSWLGLLLSFTLVGAFVFGVLYFDIILIKIVSSLFLGLSLLRVFSLYHEYQHHAILQNSYLAKLLMKTVGFMLLSPSALWNNYHDLHHRENSKFTLKIMGNFPTVTLEEYNEMSSDQKKQYLLKRNFWVILFGYLTVFIISFCLNPFKDNPKKHFLGLIVVLFHAFSYFVSIYYLGTLDTLLLITMPLFLFGFLGGVIFYLQHNCDGLVLFNQTSWTRINAAIYSSSYIKMNAFWRFFTANVGFHNVHHLNSKIPYYQLPKAMKFLMREFPEITTVSFNLTSVLSAFHLKVYDSNAEKLVPIV